MKYTEPISILFLFLALESGALIVFWIFYEKIQRKNLRQITVSKKWISRIFSLEFSWKIFIPCCRVKKSCKKWFNYALWEKIIELGKKCISVYVITKMNGNHFLPSSMKQVILKQKWKIISWIFLLLYDLIHIHIESLLYLWKHTCQTWGSLYREKYKNCFLKMGRNSYK